MRLKNSKLLIQNEKYRVDQFSLDLSYPNKHSPFKNNRINSEHSCPRYLLPGFFILILVLYLTPFYQMIGEHSFQFTLYECNRSKTYCLDGLETTKYIVQTNGCSIIDMDPFDPSVKKFIKKGKPMKCKNVLVSLTNQTLKINTKSKSYKKSTTCCYKQIARLTQSKIKYDKNADWSISVSKNCIPINETGTFVESEFMQIECTGVDTDFLVNDLPPTQKSNYTKNKAKLWSGVKELPPSVLVIGIDSISRLHMYRQLPKTKTFLEQNGFFEMKGFTKIGENTFPNIMGSFGGMLPFNYPCWPSRSTKIDDCPFIWKNFSEKGYLTGLVEDSPGLAIFNYEKTGFLEQPVDYYLRPLLVASHLHHKYGKSSGAISCFGGVNPTELMKSYLESIINTNGLTNPYFLLSWFTSIGHDDFNGLQTADNTFRDLLQTAVLGPESGSNNTLILFISDHGYRFGKFRETFLGYYEESLPFFYIRVPETIKTKFPLWYANLEQNQNKLTTPLDLHRTFVDILNIQKSSYSPVIPGTYSFFEKIPGNRTCESSHIPSRYCMCGVTPELNQKSEKSISLSKYVVNDLNEELKAANATNQCHQLKLSSVLYGRQLVPGETWNQFGKIIKYQDFLVAFEVSPGKGHFEAKIRQWENGTLATSSPSRINSYKGQSDCMSDYILKGLCMCKKLVKLKG